MPHCRASMPNGTVQRMAVVGVAFLVDHDITAHGNWTAVFALDEQGSSAEHDPAPWS